MPEIEQSGAEQAAESDYETYLKQRSLNASLANCAVYAGVWLALAALVVAAASMVRSDADVVGMDPAGREHPIVVKPISAVGVKQ